MIRILSIVALCATGSPALAAPPRPAKIVVIGIDGVSLNLLEPFAKAGVTPVMGALLRDGARGHLASIWPLRTPQVWTSAVTGKLPGQHGIWDHLSNTYFNPPEFRTRDKRRVTSEQRRAKALWQLLGDAGLKSLTVGWMASWPAEQVKHGVMVAPAELMGDRRQTTIKGSFYSDAARMVSPAKWEKRVRSLIVDPSDITAADLAPFADPPAADSPLYARLPYLERYVYGLNWSLARARSVERITVELARAVEPDVVMSYFQCPDSLLHRFWIFHKSPEDIRVRLQTHGLPEGDADELHRRFGRVVEACYRDVDERVGRILEATRGPDTLVLIVSDHGFGNAPVPHLMRDEPYSGDHLDDGVVLAVGPQVAAGSIIRGMSILDVTPTLLHRLGLAVASDMQGRVVSELTGAAADQVRTLPSYEDAPQTEIPYPEGWPPRKKAYRSAADN